MQENWIPMQFKIHLMSLGHKLFKSGIGIFCKKTRNSVLVFSKYELNVLFIWIQNKIVLSCSKSQLIIFFEHVCLCNCLTFAICEQFFQSVKTWYGFNKLLKKYLYNAINIE